MAEGKQIKLHFATDNHVKKNGIYYVPFSKLKILDGFNDRTDYGTKDEMSELAESIYHTGPKVPLKGYKEGEYYIVIVGHRRFRAAEMIKKNYNKNIIFPMQMYPPGTTAKDMLLDTLLTNSGKELTPLEKASTVSKLIEEQVPVAEIASSLGGVSQVYIKNLQRLWAIPEEAKKLIRDGVVSATLIMGYLKNKNTDIEELIKELKKQAGLADKENKPGKASKKKTAKVTAKNAPAKKNDGLGDFKKFRKDKSWTFQNHTKKECFNMFCKILDNKVSSVDIMAFFTSN